jgi:hypothetical protein
MLRHSGANGKERSMRKGLLLAIAAACLVSASVALAAPAVSNTTLKMKDRGTGVEYSGKVTADPPKTICIAQRRIEVFHAGVRIATTLTEENGSWKVEGPRPPVGDEVTVIAKKVKRKGKTKCKTASVTEVYGGG